MNFINEYIYKNDNGKRIYPQIYIYSDKNYPSWIKIGYTTRKNPEDRVREQYNTLLQLDNEPYVMVFTTEAVRYNGVSFTDKDIHRLLKKYSGLSNRGEFYRTNDLFSITKLIIDVKNDITNFEGIRPVCKAIENKEASYTIPKIKSSVLKPVVSKNYHSCD